MLGRNLQDVQRQLFYYHAKQARRWLHARDLREDRGLVTREVVVQLVNHLKKSPDQLLHPKITDRVLLPAAKGLLSQLEMEREAAKAEQGNPERVMDWWPGATIVGKKKRKRRVNGKKQGATASQGVNAEGSGDEDGALGWGEDEMDVDEGGVLLSEKEEFEGFNSPVMMSPEGSEMGGEGEGEGGEEEDEVE